MTAVAAWAGPAAGVASVAALAQYIRDMLRPGTGKQPERMSWLIWSTEYGVLIAALVVKRAPGSLWVIGTQFAGCLLIYGLSFRRPAAKAEWWKWLLLAGSAAALVAWWRTNDPAAAIILSIAAESAGVLITVVKVYRRPGTESVRSWLLLAPAGLFGILAVGRGAPGLLYAYPASLVVMSFLVPAASGLGAVAVALRYEPQHAAPRRRPLPVIPAVARPRAAFLAFAAAPVYDPETTEPMRLPEPARAPAIGPGVAFVAHCLLNQNAKVTDAAHCKGISPWIIAILRDRGWRIEQMPCPEIGVFGHQRSWMVREQMTAPAARMHFERLAVSVAETVIWWLRQQVPVVFVGVEGSPSMGVLVTSSDPARGGRPETPAEFSDQVPGEGLFVAELRQSLTARGYLMPVTAAEMHDVPDYDPGTEQARLTAALDVARKAASR